MNQDVTKQKPRVQGIATIFTKPTKKAKLNIEDELDTSYLDSLIEDFKISEKPTKANKREPEETMDEDLLAEFSQEIERVALIQHIIEKKKNFFKIRGVFKDVVSARDHNKQATYFGSEIFEQLLSIKQKFLILQLQSEEYALQDIFFVIALGQWAEFFYQEGDSLNTYGSFDPETLTLVVANQNTVPNSIEDLSLIIVDPSRKVKVTDLTENYRDCERFKLLKGYFQERRTNNIYGLEGTIQHDIFEEIAQADTSYFPSSKVDKLIEDKMATHIADMREIHIDYEHLRQSLNSAVMRMIKWKQTYVGTDTPIYYDKITNTTLRLKKVECTEKRFESDFWGLVGIVDVIFEGEFTVNGNEIFRKSIPFELKTGKSDKPGHKTQVILYNLMMEEKGELDHKYGILYYSNLVTDHITTKNSPISIYNIFTLRNTMVSTEKRVKHNFIDFESFRPPRRFGDISECRFCPLKQFCVATNVMEKMFDTNEKRQGYVVSFEEENQLHIDDISGLGDYNTYLISSGKKKLESEPSASNEHLDSNKSSLSKKEDSMMSFEDALNDFNQEYSQSIRNNFATILNALKFPSKASLISESEPEFDEFGEIYSRLSPPKIKYLARWIDLILLEQQENRNRRKHDTDQSCIYFDLDSFNELKIIFMEEKDYISDKKKQIILNFTFYCSDEDTIGTQLLESLSIQQHMQLNHITTNVSLSGTLRYKRIEKKQFGSCFGFQRIVLSISFSYYHICAKMKQHMVNDDSTFEKFSTGWSYLRRSYEFSNKMIGNIVNLITTESNLQLAEIITNKMVPKEVKLPIDLDTLIKGKNINQEQREAIMRTLQSDSFSLIVGMPGTGKTRTICIMLAAMISLGMKVIVTSYTHSALDNILIKFISMFAEFKSKIIRMSASKGTSKSDLADITFKQNTLRFYKDIEVLSKQKQVYFTTCLSLHNPLLHLEKFDYVLVDEASQIVEANLIESLTLANKFVLIGDYKQLCPLIKSPVALLRGMGISLLERLSMEHPSWAVSLTQQVISK